MNGCGNPEAGHTHASLTHRVTNVLYSHSYTGSYTHGMTLLRHTHTKALTTNISCLCLMRLFALRQCLCLLTLNYSASLLGGKSCVRTAQNQSTVLIMLFLNIHNETNATQKSPACFSKFLKCKLRNNY